MNAPPSPFPDAALSEPATDERPILVVPYMWIGDFVRGHSVVTLLKARWPRRPIDMLATSLTAPLVDYMPGVRKAVVADLLRGRLGLARQAELGARLRAEGYGDALVMPRTWKSAIAPWLAGIPRRTGYFGEARLFLLNDIRSGERALASMAERCVALAQPKGASPPADIPVPRLSVPAQEIQSWRERHGFAGSARLLALAPGSVGPAKRWTCEGYAAVAAHFAAQGITAGIVGGPGEKELASEIAKRSGGAASDLTGADLREGILALAAADAVASNDSGLLHVAAALGRPTVGIFGPTDPKLWAPLNPLTGIIRLRPLLACQPCHRPVCRLAHHRCMRDIPARDVIDPLAQALVRPAAAANGQSS